jgi:hypothetical protein
MEDVLHPYQDITRGTVPDRKSYKNRTASRLTLCQKSLK